MNHAAPVSHQATSPAAGWLWIVLLCGAWFWTFRAMSLWWNYAPAYEYGFVVPWIALFLAWQRVRRNPGCLEGAPAPGRRWVVPVVAACAWVLFLFGELLRQVDPMWRPMNWVFASASTLLTFCWAYRRGGEKLARALAFPILFTWAALPWPGFIDDPLTMQLRAVVTVITVQLLHALGISAVQEVNVIQLAAGPVGVEDACSGIVSFHSSLMAALFLGEFLWLGWGRRLVLIAAGCVIAVGGNLLRTFALCWLVEKNGLGAVALHHDRLGLISSIAIFLGILLFGWALSRWRTQPSEILAPPEVGLTLLRGGRFAPRGGIVLLAAFASVPFIGHAWFAVRPDGGAKVQEGPLWAIRPQRTPADWKITPVEILESQRTTLGFTIGEAFTLQNAQGGLQLYHFFWGAERSGLPYAHTPDICMSYIGWTQPGPARSVTLRLRGVDYPARSFRFVREGQEVTALHTFWRGGEPGLTGNELLDNRKLARLPLLFSGPRLFGMEELLIFVAAPGDEDSRIRFVSEVLSQIMTPVDLPEPGATVARQE